MVSNDCSISLYTTDILLRYKSEWDPRAHAHTKGGYLDGEIRVPRVSHLGYFFTKMCLKQFFSGNPNRVMFFC